MSLEQGTFQGWRGGYQQLFVVLKILQRVRVLREWKGQKLRHAAAAANSCQRSCHWSYQLALLLGM